MKDKNDSGADAAAVDGSMATSADTVAPHDAPQPSAHWAEDCEKWRGHLLTGKYAHWCLDWDDLPIDETCPEWPCGCYPDARDHRDQTIANLREVIRELTCWQHIESAPKDGTPILVYEDSCGGMEVFGVAAWVEYRDGSNGWSGSSFMSKDGNGWTTLLQPTLWRPLPDWPTRLEVENSKLPLSEASGSVPSAAPTSSSSRPHEEPTR